MKVFIFGLGYSSLAFLRGYGARFAQVSGTVRIAEKAIALQAQGINAITFDSESVGEHLKTVDFLLISIPPRENDPTLERYGEAIAASPVRTIVYLSTIGVYGNQDGGWVDETTPVEPYSERSRHRASVERQWLEFGARAGKKVLILRLAGIYGPGQNALENLKAGTAKRIIKAGQVFNRIHVADIAAAIAAGLAFSGNSGIFNVTDDEPAPPQDVVTFAAKLLNMPPPPEVAFEQAEMSEMARSFYSKNQRVRNVRLRTELGVNLTYPTYREGILALYRSGSSDPEPS